MSHVVDRSRAEVARDALERHDWRQAFDVLSQADAAGGDLSAEELELLADASAWVGEMPASIDARERAVAAFVASGVPERAAACAARLAADHVIRGMFPVATAWVKKGERLLEGRPESPAHGWLAVNRSFKAFFEGDIERALADAAAAAEIAERFGDRDLAALARNSEGRCLLALGRVDEGLDILDEAAVAAVTGELTPWTAGGVYCATIGACAALGDWTRAAQWTDAQDRWCKREQIAGFPGMCRLHRAEIKRMRGAWLEAEAEAKQASEELRTFIPAAVALALYEIGEIKLRRGDLAGAEEVLLRAHAMGRDPEPALSLLRLAEGKVDAAKASIHRALEGPDWTPSWSWAPPDSPQWRIVRLPAMVEISLAAGDVPAARAAADELASLATTYTSLQVRACAATSQGAVQLAEGRPAEARAALRSAMDLWRELDAPYEAAKCRLMLAEAFSAGGDSDRAVLELRAAREVFAALGALPDLGRTDDALERLDARGVRAAAGGAASGARADRAFMFTDIVDSTRLLDVLGDESWEHLSQWHDETIRSLVARHGGEEVKTTGDGFFVAFERIAEAVRCAVAIQRDLAEHRRTSGFALTVRIGIHRGIASRRGSDYAGKAVNQAARVGALAEGGEILVTAGSVEGSEAGLGFGLSEPRTVRLKGIAEPIEVVAVHWR